MLKPGSRSVTVVDGEVILVIAAPFAAHWIVRLPVPGPADCAASVYTDALHCNWSAPAAATGGAALFVSTTSSKLVHAPFVIVQRRVTLDPGLRPVTVLNSDP